MIAIIKYNAGNIQSVKNALNRLGCECVITNRASDILMADQVIFPGVGEASSAMQYLHDKGIAEVIKKVEQPFLGICLGLQLMCENSEEGNTPGLGIFQTEVKIFPPEEKVPHMGWNNFETNNSVLLDGVALDDDCYYVHSYYAELCTQTAASCNYILPFSAVLEKDQFYATQFHPEKSADVGEQILQNFLQL